jgi:hypothetical protein
MFFHLYYPQIKGTKLNLEDYFVPTNASVLQLATQKRNV